MKILIKQLSHFCACFHQPSMTTAISYQRFHLVFQVETKGRKEVDRIINDSENKVDECFIIKIRDTTPKEKSTTRKITGNSLL